MGVEDWVKDWIAIGSATVAFLSLVANVLVVRRQLRLQTEELRSAQDAETAAWCAETLRAFEHVKGWLDVGESGSGAAPIGLTPPLLLAERLSSLADLGRLYFPNLDPHAKGAANPEAFRGSRQPALDAVLIAYAIIRDIAELPQDQRKPASDLVFAARRLLISEVQLSRDPRRLALLYPLGMQTKRSIETDPSRNVRPLVDGVRRLGLSADMFTGSLGPTAEEGVSAATADPKTDARSPASPARG